MCISDTYTSCFSLSHSSPERSESVLKRGNERAHPSNVNTISCNSKHEEGENVKNKKKTKSMYRKRRMKIEKREK